jgi:phage baseplate assembly protein V
MSKLKQLKILRDIISQVVAPIRNRVMMLIARGVVESLKDDTGLQTIKLKLLAGENRDGIERFQNYGFTSVPLPDSEAVVIFQGGNREAGLVIAIDDRNYRLKGLDEGEVAIYTDEGDKIHIKRGGELLIEAATKTVVKSPLVELGDGVLEKILNGETFQTFFNAHTHPFTGNLGITAVTATPSVPSTPIHLSNIVKGAK